MNRVNHCPNPPQEIEITDIDALTRAGHLLPVYVGAENTYYVNAAGLNFFCKEYENAGKYPKEYRA